ncbi:hypothetical protein ABEY55_08005 [Priestia aryabhattai]|uniref:hypothetical protein n=1 Tax=Priestia aryabhattai TaxID=412384 RepID=UPI003D2980D4
MFQFIKVKLLFEGQFHQRHHFTIRLSQHDYQGIYYKNKIQWLLPSPYKFFPEKDAQILEDNIHKIISTL